jgi:hypothetical protein
LASDFLYGNWLFDCVIAVIGMLATGTALAIPEL